MARRSMTCSDKRGKQIALRVLRSGISLLKQRGGSTELKMAGALTCSIAAATLGHMRGKYGHY